jgi:membrane-associated phospholipid phosphatase
MPLSLRGCSRALSAQLLASLLGLGILASAPAAHAEPAAEPEEDGFVMHYRWRPFGVWDYVGTATVLGSYYLIESSLDNPDHSDFRHIWPGLDNWVRDLSVADTRAGREHAAKVSDHLWKGLIAFSVVDSFVTPLVRGFDYESTFYMTLMNVQAYSVVSVFLRVPHKLIGRDRPLAVGCESDIEYAADCKTGGRFVSFYGGHLATSLTAAGLVCAHHLHGKLYGNEVADAATCVSAVSLASTAGYLRLRADKHWFTDQVLGAAVGLSSGYLLPTLLYYRPWEKRPAKPRKAGSYTPRLHWSVMPMITPDSASATLVASY